MNGHPGLKDVKINDDNSASAVTYTVYASPTISALGPSKGPIDGGTFVEIQGSGFDVDAIKAGTEPKDIQQHRVLGPCYRLRLLASGTRGSRGWRGRSEVSAKGKKRKLADAFDDLHNEEDPKQRRLED